MLTLDQARSKMLEQIPFPTQTESLNLQEAANRICAEDIISPINVPSFDNSAMDGYAVRLSDLQQSLTLSIAGKSFAGNPFQEEWQLLSAVRIMTGAMIPEGADAVIMQELVTLNEDGTVTFSELPKQNQNIRRIGEDVKKRRCGISTRRTAYSCFLAIISLSRHCRSKMLSPIKSRRTLNWR